MNIESNNLRNQHRLILVVGQHVNVGAVGNGENVGWHLRTTLASVKLGTSERVHGESLVRVDGHTEETRVRLYGDLEILINFPVLVISVGSWF